MSAAAADVVWSLLGALVVAVLALWRALATTRERLARLEGRANHVSHSPER